MKPTGQIKRPKDWLPFVNFAMIKEIPVRLNLTDHLFPYIGSEDDTDFIWGVYGTTSINAAIFSAASHAADLSAAAPGSPEIRSLQLTAWFSIENFRSIPTQLSAEDVRRHGYLHLGRMVSSFRENLRGQWIDWIHNYRPHEASILGPALDSLKLDEIAVRFPQFVKVLLRDDPTLNAVIHPVFQTYQKARIPLWILMARRNTDRLVAAEARFVPSVQVDV